MTGHSGRWAFRVMQSRVRCLGELRHHPGVEAALYGEYIWVHGSGLDGPMFAVLAACADGPVFVVDRQDRLIPYGSAVPVERLPTLPWKSLAQLLEPELPITQVVTARFSSCPLRLERSPVEQPGAVLVTRWSDFESWSAEASEVRLRACQFAVYVEAQRQLVCIRGRPLPPLAGTFYWTAGNVAVPCGFTWSPAVDADILRSVLLRRFSDCGEVLSTADLLIWHESGVVDVIHRGEFLPALRTHVRTTAASLAASEAGASNRTDGGSP